MITLEQAKQLSYRDEIFETTNGRVKKWRVNGQVKTWKRSPDRVRVPLKHGLYVYDYLDETLLKNFYLTEAEAKETI